MALINLHAHCCKIESRLCRDPASDLTLKCSKSITRSSQFSVSVNWEMPGTTQQESTVMYFYCLHRFNIYPSPTFIYSANIRADTLHSNGVDLSLCTWQTVLNLPNVEAVSDVYSWPRDQLQEQWSRHQEIADDFLRMRTIIIELWSLH